MRLGEIASYACYYGYGRLAQLAAYQLVILQAGAYTAQEVAWLRGRGTETLAYLSVGEVPAPEADSAWTICDPASGLPLQNPRWNTLLADCRSPAWQQHLLSSAIPDLLAHGVTGLFLDTVDVQDQAPATRPGVVDLLRLIRSNHADITIMINRGFSIMDVVLDVADGVLFEAFTTHHDGQLYAAWEGSDLAWTAQMAVRLHETAAEMPLFALDYAPPEAHALRTRATRRAQAYGMRSFIAPYGLDWLPEIPPQPGVS